MKAVKYSLVVLSLVAVFLLLQSNGLFAESEAPAATPPPSEPDKPAKDEKAEEPKDITEQVKKYNSAEYTSPPSSFRKGHVTTRELSKDAIKRSETGYQVQLPSKAPVATPTVYDGNVYVSGGFHSKEFYAFDAKSGDLKWAVNLDDDGPSSAVARDGVVIFNTESCTIFALDAKTGRQLWSWWLGDPLMSTPTIANGKVFTSYPASGRQSGMVQQQMQTNSNMISPPPNSAPVANTEKTDTTSKSLKVPPASHVLAAFDLKTGKILWQRWIDADVMSAPVASGTELYVTTFAGTMYKFNQADGEILSARQVRATSAPVVVDGDMFYTKRADKAGSGLVEEAAVKATRSTGRETSQTNRKAAPYLDGRVQSKSSYKSLGGALDAANGFAGGAPAQANAEAAYSNVGQSNVSTLQAYQGSRILNYGDNNYSVMGDEIVCNDVKSGKKLWSQKLSGDMKKAGGFIGTPPAAAGGSIFVGTLNGKVLQIDPKSGKQIKAYDVGSPIRFQPVVQDGMIYVGTQDGKLVAIDTKDPKLTGWPMWGGDAEHTGFRQAVK
jgi:Ca-activated chloride channel homolog